MKTKKVFVLRNEGDVYGVFDSEKEAESSILQYESPDLVNLDLWLIEETTYYYTKETA
jgi:hypothetical protein